MLVFRSMTSGFLGTARVPRVVIGLWLVNLMLVLPAGWVMTGVLERSIGASRVHSDLRQGFDLGWYGEFRTEARGIETSFRPTVAAETAFYDNLEGWATGEFIKEFPGLVGLGILYALVWALLLGGVLQRFARPDGERGVAGFVRSAGWFYPRFLRLALLSLPLYWAVYRLHRFMYARLESATRDVTEEVSILLVSLAALAVTIFLLTLIQMIFGYAKIATVVEERRSMLLAALRGARFVLRHPLRTCGLYYGMLLIAVVLLTLYGWLGPGIGQSTPLTVFIAFAVGQLYLVARLVVRLALLGGQLDLFQRLTR